MATQFNSRYRFPVRLNPDDADGVFEGRNLEYLVYVQGQDLTPWVAEITVQQGPNGSADITFKDSYDSLSLTNENVLRNKWREIPYSPFDELYEIPLSDSSVRQVTARGPLETPDDFEATASELPKKRIYEWKRRFNQLVLTGSDQNIDANDEQFPVWPLKPPQCIIQRMDTIRIFVAVPWVEQTEPARWLPYYNGYVTSVSRVANKVAGNAEVTITVTCSDLKYVLMKSRIAKNPVVNSYGTIAEPVISGRNSVESNIVLRLFRDGIISNSDFTTEISSKTPEELTCLLLFGHTNYQTGIAESASKERKTFAVGNLEHTVDKKRFFWMGGENNPLEQVETTYANGKFYLGSWQDACLYGTDERGNIRRTPWTLKECHEAGINSYFGGVDCPHGANTVVRFLSPAEGFGFTSLSEKVPVNVGTEADFVSRLDMMASFLDPINYQFWINGNGDLIFEYPQNDFLPEDYGYYNKPQYPNWSQLLRLYHYSTESHSENDVEVPTIIDVRGGNLAANVTPEGNATGRATGLVVVLSALASRFGMIPTSLTFPFNYNGNSLLFYALSYVQQRLAEVETFTYSDVPWTPGLMPNRPIFVQDTGTMCCISSTGTSIDAKGNVSYNVELDFARKPNAKGEYITYFGSPRNPATYRDTYKQSVNTSQVTIEPPVGVYTHNQENQSANADTIRSATGQQDQTTESVRANTPFIPGVTPIGSGQPNAQATEPYTGGAGTVSPANINRVNTTTLTPEQASHVARVSNGDPEKERFLTNVLKIENRGKAHPGNAVSRAGAAGAFQFMPNTARDVGMQVDGVTDDRNDFGKSAEGASKLYDDLNRRYGGNTAAMYADYNGGPRQGRKVVEGNYSALPGETRDYVAMGMYLEDVQTGKAAEAEAYNQELLANASQNTTGVVPVESGFEQLGVVGRFMKANPQIAHVPISNVAETASEPSIITNTTLDDPNPQYKADSEQSGQSKVTADTGGSTLDVS